MSTPVIETTSLHKNYGDLEAVKDLNIKVESAQVFGFLGPNGAGKSTSLKMMVGLLKPTSGDVLINGKDPAKHSQELKAKIGHIPQDIVIWEELTVEENLWYMASLYRIPKDQAKASIDRLIDEIQLEDKRKARAKTLSGGLKRRLNIILGLVHEPDIVVCDEPTPGLDPQSRTLVWEFILDLAKKKGKTVILTTHFMEEADRLSDTVAIIDHGKLLVVDTPENLKNSIGEGDLIEIKLNDDDLYDEALARLQDYPNLDNVGIYAGNLQVNCLNAPSKLAGILNAIEAIEGLDVVDMKIRKATLEDVFIHLTGRELRE
ncbi:MAG: ABC transporter ATP-binding protein [Candidatus Kariarchaeaceae archaeon]|jgi:ABC-2 type transport system ATP-binding protein